LALVEVRQHSPVIFYKVETSPLLVLIGTYAFCSPVKRGYETITG